MRTSTTKRMCWFAVVTLSIAPTARAFDSAGADIATQTRSPAMPAARWPFFSPHFVDHQFPEGSACTSGRADLPSVCTYFPDDAHFGLRANVSSLGGIDGITSNDRIVTGYYTCDRGAVGATGSTVDLSKCDKPDFTTGESFKHSLTSAGWVRARKRWDVRPDSPSDVAATGASPEHMLILEAAAKFAGFGSLQPDPITTLFWVRYPTANRWVVSPTRPDAAGEVPADLVVGQSLIPEHALNAQSFALRGLRLSELAQLPDVSNSLADFAAGNETCPFLDDMHDALEAPGVSPFSGDTYNGYDINACHSFQQVMGAVNVTHFLPGAKACTGTITASRQTEWPNARICFATKSTRTRAIAA